MNYALRKPLALSTIVGFAFVSGTTCAAELRLTGFGTLGYAQSSESDFTYLRYIDNHGTLKADSIVGAQAALSVNPQWSATMQVVAGAPRDRDDGTEAKVHWAFVSYRPNSDWLFRVGRVRTPFLFHTQNAEVGVTYDYVRLPVEAYGLIPIYDFDGAALTKTWSLGDSEFSLDAFWGKSDIDSRLFLRDLNRPLFIPGKATARGVVISYAAGQLSLRGGIHYATIDYGPNAPVETLVPTQPFDPVPPPLGGTLYIPGRPIPKPDLTVWTLGVDWRSNNWNLVAEYVQRNVADTKDTGKTRGGYVTVSHAIGKLTPYVTYARVLSGEETRNLIDGLNQTPVPLLAQEPPLSLSASYHRLLADLGIVYDQYSGTIGASYSFTPKSKAKIEWTRTKVGLVSAFVDGDVRDRSFNVISLAYSVAF